MSKRFGVIPLEDVYPLADDYGNEFAQRDYSLEVNQDYVRELADSMRRKGEPDEPITVIQDGGIYYVKTGRSRYEAMKLLGTREFHAVIDDDTSRQEAIEAIIRTDLKKRYEGLEKSRMVQQLQMFGDDQYVSEVAGITVEQSRKVRRARKRVDDAGDDMTLERMYVIAEFEDDPEAVEQLSTCAEGEVSWRASQLRKKREKRERRDAFAAAFEALGVPSVDERGGVAGMSYFVAVPEPAEVADYLPPEWEDGQVAAFLSETYDGVRAEVYVSAELADGDESDEDAELRRMEDAYEDAIAEMDRSRSAWFWGNLAAGRPMPNVLRKVEEHFRDQWFVDAAIKAMTDEAKAAAKNKGLSVYDQAIGVKSFSRSGSAYAWALATGGVESYRAAGARAYLDELALCQADGWDPEDALALIERLSGIVDDEESEGEDE